MTATPRCIRISLMGFFLAFLSEAVVEVVLIYFHFLSWDGCLVVFASLIANPLAIGWALKRKRRGYELLKWIAALSLLWTISGGPYLHALGVWAIALIALCAWLRVGAVLMLRRKAAKDWVDAATV